MNHHHENETARDQNVLDWCHCYSFITFFRVLRQYFVLKLHFSTEMPNYTNFSPQRRVSSARAQTRMKCAREKYFFRQGNLFALFAHRGHSHCALPFVSRLLSVEPSFFDRNSFPESIWKHCLVSMGLWSSSKLAVNSLFILILLCLQVKSKTLRNYAIYEFKSWTETLTCCLNDSHCHVSQNWPPARFWLGNQANSSGWSQLLHRSTGASNVWLCG
jgi:hypothetical protein